MEKRYALLIDAENADIKYLDNILDEIKAVLVGILIIRIHINIILHLTDYICILSIMTKLNLSWS